MKIIFMKIASIELNVNANLIYLKVSSLFET